MMKSQNCGKVFLGSMTNHGELSICPISSRSSPRSSSPYYLCILFSSADLSMLIGLSFSWSYLLLMVIRNTCFFTFFQRALTASYRSFSPINEIGFFLISPGL